MRTSSHKIKPRLYNGGFALVEFITAMLLSAIVLAGAGLIFDYNYSLIRKEIIHPQSWIEPRLVLDHLTKNINNSAWVSVIDKNTIMLHSHSYPKIRIYIFKDNELKYAEFSPNRDPSVMYNGEYKVIGGPFYSDIFFKGSGGAKHANQYGSVEIDLNQDKANMGQTSNNGISTAVKIFCAESRDFIYVDPENPNNLSGGLPYEDGTKVFPYMDVQTALDSLSSYPPFSEEIDVISGVHTLTKDIYLPCHALLFGSNSEVIFSPGINITLGDLSALIIDGKFTMSGTMGNMITIKHSMSSGIKPLLHIMSDSQIKKIDFVFMSNFNLRVEAKTAFDLNMTNCIFENLSISVRQYSGGTLSLSNCQGSVSGSSKFESFDNDSSKYEIRDMSMQSFPVNLIGYKKGSINNNLFGNGNIICSGTIGTSQSVELRNNKFNCEFTAVRLDNLYAANNIFYDFFNFNDIPRVTLKNNYTNGIRYNSYYPTSYSGTIQHTFSNNVIKNIYIYSDVIHPFLISNCVIGSLSISDSTISNYCSGLSIKNIIVPTPGGVSAQPSLLSKITYSDIYNGTGTFGAGTIKADPKLDADYRPAEPLCLNKGDPLVRNPDGSRSHMGIYGGPDSAGWDNGIGKQ